MHLKFVQQISGMVFFDKFGKRLDSAEVDKEEKAYVLIGMVAKNDHLKKEEMEIDDLDLELAKKLWVNQIKTEPFNGIIL